MIDTILHTIDNILFFCITLSGIYVFIFALMAIFRRSEPYHKAKKQHRFIILTPANTDIGKQEYPDHLYTISTYEDLFQTVKQLDETQYDIAIVLGETTRISLHLLEKVNKAYDTGIIAMQLHHIIEHRATSKIRRKAINEEIKNSILRLGHNQVGLSSAFETTDIAIDLNWLKHNMKSAKSNLESMLLRQDIYIEYLHNAHVYSDSPRLPRKPMSKRKAISKLPVTLMGRNWDYADKLFRQFLPSWKAMLTITSIWCLVFTCYSWIDSLKWWLLLLGLVFTVALAIPDYLVEKHKKLISFKKRGAKTNQ